MNKAIPLAVAGAALLGASVGAHAAPAAVPSSNATDLWLFVTDVTSNMTYVRDTGITLASLTPAFTAGASLLAAPAHFGSIGADATLTSFIGSFHSGDNIEWGVEGAQYNGAKPQTAGNVIAVTANTAPGGNTAQITPTSLEQWTGVVAGGGFNTDAVYMANSLAAGSSFVFNLANGSAASNAWGTGTGNKAGSTDLYGVTPNAAISGVGSIASTHAAMYLLTGNGSVATPSQSYALGNIQLLTNGTFELVPAAVPLPAALWLFGSGLLGLVGIGRRRTQTT